MREVTLNLFVGNDEDVAIAKEKGMRIIHACKTSHKKELGYEGNLSNTDANYLIYHPKKSEKPEELFLNMVDMKRPLMSKFTNPIMKAAFTFIDDHITKGEILVHCNQGVSRSPMIAMLWMASGGKFTTDTYTTAKQEFMEMYPEFNPGAGIESYARKHYIDIVKL
jgi:hypothetical protein